MTIREDITLEVALRYLRRLGSLLDLTDKLFIVDRNVSLLGVLPLKRMVVNDLYANLADIIAPDAVVFHPECISAEVASAFECYDLVTAPVVDKNNKLVGRITLDAVMDYIRDESESDMLSMAGLREEGDFLLIFGNRYKTAGLGWQLTW